MTKENDDWGLRDGEAERLAEISFNALKIYVEGQRNRAFLAVDTYKKEVVKDYTFLKGAAGFVIFVCVFWWREYWWVGALVAAIWWLIHKTDESNWDAKAVVYNSSIRSIYAGYNSAISEKASELDILLSDESITYVGNDMYVSRSNGRNEFKALPSYDEFFRTNLEPDPTIV